MLYFKKNVWLISLVNVFMLSIGIAKFLRGVWYEPISKYMVVLFWGFKILPFEAKMYVKNFADDKWCTYYLHPD